MSKTIKGLAFGIVAALGLGAAPTFAWLAGQNGVNTYELLTARFFIASLLLAGFLHWKKEPHRLTARERIAAVTMGLFGYAASSVCYFSAQKLIPVSLAAILLYTYPAVVACLMALSGHEKLDGVKKAALLISFTGLLLSLGPSFGETSLTGLGLGITASLVFAFYIIVGNYILTDFNTLAVTTWVTFTAGLSIGLVGLLSGQLYFQFALKGWLAILGIAFFSTVIALLFFLKAMVLIGASRASIVSTLEQPVTMVLAAVILAEKLGFLQLLGGALVLVSALLVNWVKTKKPAVFKPRPSDYINKKRA